jgi:hypothetical protein
MNPFMLMIMLFQVYQSLHSQFTSGALSQMHGVIHIVAQQDSPQTNGGQVGPQVPIATVTL